MTFSKAILLLLALHTQKVFSRAYHNPTVPLFTPSHQSHGETAYESSHARHHGDIRYDGPTTVPHVLHDGHIADTHEVAAAKADHLAAVSKASIHSGRFSEESREYSGHGDIRYHGPTTVPHVLHDGHIADTHEVAAAKADHLAAVSKASVPSGRSSEEPQEYSGHGDIRYHGPTAVPHLLHDGHIADTHEVAAAKADHLAAVSKASVHSGRFSEESQEYSGHGDIRYHGPTTVPHVLHDGHIADTHEVAAAKADHLAAVSKASVHSGRSSEEPQEYSGHGDIRYHGPTAVPHVLHDGHIADTHEVAAAKADHLAAVSKASVPRGRSSEEPQEYSGHGDIRYHGPTAVPHLLHDGHIADTHEVAAAKADHLAAVSKASVHSGRSSEESQEYSGHGDIRYHGPTAIPHVLHDGHIADTHQVAAAKANHLAALAKAQADAGHNHGYSETQHGYASDPSYHGPIAKPHVLHNGYLVDTHEVAAAKHHHYQALNAASIRSHDVHYQ